MKKRIILIFITIFISISSYGDCKNQYKTQIIEAGQKAVGKTALGVSSAYLAILPIYIGVVVGTTGEPIAGISCTALGVSSIGVGAHEAGKGISMTSNINSVYRGLKLIKESEVGFGKNITNLAEELSEELDREVSESEIITLINKGNEDKIFCSGIQDNLYNDKEIYKYLLDFLP